MNALAITDFEKQPCGPYFFNRWVAAQQIPTPLGTFAIQFQMNDTNPPENEMLLRASELIRFVETHGEQLLDIVYGHYLLTAEPPDWLESFDVPRGLNRAEVPAYISDHRLLVVSRHLNWKEQYRRVVFVDPLWDTEHKLSLDLRNGSTATANESRFRLESQVLRWLRN
jgi:hypothetical protein